MNLTTKQIARGLKALQATNTKLKFEESSEYIELFEYHYQTGERLMCRSRILYPATAREVKRDLLDSYLANYAFKPVEATSQFDSMFEQMFGRGERKHKKEEDDDTFPTSYIGESSSDYARRVDEWFERRQLRRNAHNAYYGFSGF